MNVCLSDLIKLPNESAVYYEAFAKTLRNLVKLKKKIHLYLNFKYGFNSVWKIKLDCDYDLSHFGGLITLLIYSRYTSLFNIDGLHILCLGA